MSKIYSFPAQQVLSGELLIEVVTSSGSGSSSLTEKYFSDELRITNETEFLAGDLQTPSAQFIIDYDKDDLFRATILPIAQTEGEYVTVKVTLDNNVRFYGVIIPTTITLDPFHATNDALDGQKVMIGFTCGWIVSLAKSINKTDFRNRLGTVAVNDGKYVSPSGNYVTDGYGYVTLRDIMDATFYLLNSVYGISYNIIYNITDITFYSKGNGANNAEYIFPYALGAGDIDYSSFGSYREPSVILGKVLYYTTGPTESSSFSFLTGGSFFADDNDIFHNAYEFFVGILKSFQLYCKIQYSGSGTLNVSIGSRLNGEEIVPVDTLEASDVPMVEIARRRINVTSETSGNSYVKDFPDLGVSEFSSQLPYDFGNDNDFPGTNADGQTVNSILSLAMASGHSYMELIRYIGLGANKLLNPVLDVNIDNWTGDGTWTFANEPFYNIGSARVTLDTVSVQTIYQTLSESMYDGVIFGGHFITNYAGGANITFYLYSGSTLLHIEQLSISSVNTDTLIYTYGGTQSRKNKEWYPLTKVVVAVQPSVAGTATDYLWMRKMFLKRARKGTPELVGMSIEDLFGSGNLSRQQRTLNGIQIFKPSDYYMVGSEKFYLKKVDWQIRNHETEIEAINYPY